MPGGREELLRTLAARGVAGERVLNALAEVPRDAFVPAELRGRAWEDRALPIGESQTISQPTVVARMCELLALSGEEVVLDVGTGSGYAAAVLARLAGRVISIERHANLSAAAAERLAAVGAVNVELLVGDGTAGVPAAAPFAAIHVAAAARREALDGLVAQLAPAGGRLVAPVGRRDQRLTRIVREGGTLTEERLDRVSFVPLVSRVAGGRARADRMSRAAPGGRTRDACPSMPSRSPTSS